MFILWTIIISLVSSVIGGIFASWIVIWKNVREQKHVYACQIWPDVITTFETIYSHSKTLIDTIDESVVNNVRLSVNDEQSIIEFNKKIREWRSDGDCREKFNKCDKNSLVTILS